MVLIRFIAGILVFSLIFYLIDNRKIILRPLKVYFYKLKIIFKRLYRLVRVSKTADYVWVELINNFKKSGLRFGQYNQDKQVLCTLELHDSRTVDFDYTIKDGKLTFRSLILSNFDEDLTNAMLVLASHFNGLITFGIVKVSSRDNYISFLHSKDLLIYSLFPAEINSDLVDHFELTKDITWAFDHLIETGDDPVFVFSEFLKRLDLPKSSD